MSNLTSGGVLDQEVLDNLRALQRPGKRIFEKIIGIYLNDSPKAIAELENALEVGDAKQIAYLAHRLRSGSANLGATNLVNYLRELEAVGRTDSWKSAASLIAQVKDEYTRVDTALRQELQVALAE